MTLLRGKNGFAEVSKNLARYRPENKFCLDHQNYVERLKYFNILATSLNVLHNYFDGPNKIYFQIYT